MTDSPFPSVFDYTDYRLYLEAWVESSRRRSPSFSFRQFARKAECAPSLLPDVISGRRRLTLEAQQKFARAMKLRKEESDYFSLLVRFQHAVKNDERNRCFDRLMQYRLRQKIKYLEPEQYRFWTEWHHAAVRELVTLPNFRNDPSWIAKQLSPPISVSEARDSISLLLSLGLLRKTPRGKLLLSQPIISSETEICSQAIRNHHAQMIDLGKQSIERFSVTEREVSSLTLGIDGPTFLALKEKIVLFKEQLLSIVAEAEGESDRVVQFNFQLFPLVPPSNREES